MIGHVYPRDETITIAVQPGSDQPAREMARWCLHCHTYATVQETALGVVLSSRDCSCGKTSARLHVYQDPACGTFGDQK